MSSIGASRPVSQLISSPSPIQATNTNKRASLLDLPAEIWAQIGRLAIDATPQLDRSAVTPWEACKGGSPARQPAITRTCRILRQELLPYYYKTRVQMTIYAGLVSDPESDVERWLQAIGHENRLSLRGLQVVSVVMDADAAAAKAKRHWGLQVEFVKTDEHKNIDGSAIAWYKVRFV